ncbi:MAG TPA: MFS transporter [Gaiellaceae bacterium]|nr:MFS transporter [Gaiellaceae bacterium]
MVALRPKDPLWRNGAFVSLWSAATVSQLGSQVSLLALPFVAIATLKATTFEVAALGMVNFAPLLIFSLPAGVWIDRVRRRPVMVAADAGRAIALASIPVAYTAGALTIWQLFAVGFFTGTLSTFFDVASTAILPSIVEREHLGDGNAKLQISNQTAQVVGPGLAGTLIGALGAPYAVVADALSFVGSAAFLSRVPAKDRPERRDSPMLADIREGLRYILRHPITRPSLAFLTTANFFNSILFSVLLLFAVRKLGLSARQVGLIFTLSNVGSLVAALSTSRLQRRYGFGRVMLVTAFSGWALLLIPFAHGATRIPFLVLALLSFGSGAVIHNASSVTIRQATTPNRLLARVAASNRMVVWGTIPIATLLGGVLGTYLGLRTAVLIGAGGRALAGMIILASPVRTVRTLADADALVEPFNAALEPQVSPSQ